MNEVLVTGAGGFIGSWLCEQLVERGFKVRALFRYTSNKSIGWLEKYHRKDEIKLFFGDICDKSIAKQAIPEGGFVINMAALIGIPYSYQAPDSYLETNIKGAINYLNCSLEKDIKGFIQTSTSETYGTAQYVPIDENHPLVAQSPYSATKIAADQLALSYFRSFDLPVVVLRPFNTYGPRQSTRAFIPTVITQLLNNKETYISVGNIDSLRDFNYVNDTANAFISILENFDDCKGEEFNACSNFQVSMKSVIDKLISISGIEKKLIIDKSRLRPTNSEVDSLWGENKKLINFTKWRPYYSGMDGFDLGLEKTFKWYKDLKSYQENTTYNT